MNKTPNNMIEAIRSGMCLGPISEVDQMIRIHVRDFMSQKFSVALLKSESDAETARVQKLWQDITGEVLP